jgi:hypothetical protein
MALIGYPGDRVKLIEEGRAASRLFSFLCPSHQFLPTPSKFSCVGNPAARVQHMISCTLQPLYKRVLIYSAFLWSGYERIVVYFAPNIQRLGLILIVFFRSGKIVGS